MSQDISRINMHPLLKNIQMEMRGKKDVSEAMWNVTNGVTFKPQSAKTCFVEMWNATSMLCHSLQPCVKMRGMV